MTYPHITPGGLTMRVEKTVFISYRYTTVYHAVAVQQALIRRGYDVFLGFERSTANSTESDTQREIDARAHVVIILTPDTLGRCTDPADRLRREIAYAIHQQRHMSHCASTGSSSGTRARC